MKPTKIKLIILVLLLLWLSAVVIYFVARHSVSQGPAQPATSLVPPSDAQQVVTTYLQARDNAVGADQPTPTAWLKTIQPITTPAWFVHLQPPKDTQTGASSADYRLAHSSGYVVKTTVSGCVWEQPLKPDATSGTVRCEVSDTTAKLSDGSTVNASQLLFGWAHNGPQPAATLKLVKQNGAWLVDSEISGQDE